VAKYTKKYFVLSIIFLGCLVLWESKRWVVCGTSDQVPDSASEALASGRPWNKTEVEYFVRHNRGRLALNTSGFELRIGVIIETTGSVDGLESRGIIVFSREGNFIHSWIPVRIIPVLSNISSVKSFRFDLPMETRDRFHRYSTTPGTGVVSGILSDMGFALNRDIKFRLIGLHDNRCEVTRQIFNSEFYANVRITEIGRFRITDIPDGIYRGVLFSTIDSQLKNAAVRHEDILAVFDRISIKKDSVSLVHKDSLIERPS